MGQQPTFLGSFFDVFNCNLEHSLITLHFVHSNPAKSIVVDQDIVNFTDILWLVTFGMSTVYRIRSSLYFSYVDSSENMSIWITDRNEYLT